MQDENEVTTWQAPEFESETAQETAPAPAPPPVRRRPVFAALWGIVVSILLLGSLGLNLYILRSLDQARQEAALVVGNARAHLRQVGSDPLVVVVEIDQQLPISQTFQIDERLTVPIDMVYPLDTVVNTRINIPLLGPQNIAVPIQANIPIQFEYTVPISMAFPISMTYDVELALPVEIEIPPELLSPVDAFLQEAEEALK